MTLDEYCALVEIVRGGTNVVLLPAPPKPTVPVKR